MQVDRQLDAAKVAGSLFDTSGGDDVNVLDSFAPAPAPPPVEKEAPLVVEKEAPPVVEKEAPPPVEKLPPVVEKAPVAQVERAPETNGVAAPPAAPTQPRTLHRGEPDDDDDDDDGNGSNDGAANAGSPEEAAVDVEGGDEASCEDSEVDGDVEYVRGGSEGSAGANDGGSGDAEDKEKESGDGNGEENRDDNCADSQDNSPREE